MYALYALYALYVKFDFGNGGYSPGLFEASSTTQVSNIIAGGVLGLFGLAMFLPLIALY